MPAAFAAATPLSESSITMQCSFAVSPSMAAFSKISGNGFERSRSAPLIFAEKYLSKSKRLKTLLILTIADEDANTSVIPLS